MRRIKRILTFHQKFQAGMKTSGCCSPSTETSFLVDHLNIPEKEKFKNGYLQL